MSKEDKRDLALCCFLVIVFIVMILLVPMAP